MSARSGPMPDHYQRVLRFVRRHVSSAEEAEDLTQEVFANAAVFLDGRGAESPALAWLYTVARRRIVDEARRLHRTQTVPLELVSEPTAPEAHYGGEVAEALDTALATMPDGQRRVVLGRLIQGRSFSDLSRELATSEDACRMRLMRGLQHLREEFMKEGLEP